MSFTPNIPQVGQSLGNSRTQILNNFSTLRAAINRNHVDVNLTDVGKHTYVDFQAQGSDPGTLANEICLYNKVSSAVARLFLRLPSNGAIFQVTGNAPLSATNGKTYLPGGLLLQWGASSVPTGGTQAVVFPVAFSTAAYNVQVTGIRSNNGGDGIFVLTGSVTASGFTLRNGSGSINVAYWMAIGVE